MGKMTERLCIRLPFVEIKDKPSLQFPYTFLIFPLLKRIGITKKALKRLPALDTKEKLPCIVLGIRTHGAHCNNILNKNVKQIGLPLKTP